MRHKMVNLDSTSHEYASKMSNFSAFVREQIRLHMEGETLEDAVRQRNHWKSHSDMLAAELDNAIDKIRELTEE